MISHYLNLIKDIKDKIAPSNLSKLLSAHPIFLSYQAVSLFAVDICKGNE